MCGIVGLHLRDPALIPQLGSLLTTMMCRLSDRGPDAAGVGIYGDPRLVPPGSAAVGILGAPPPEPLAAVVATALRVGPDVVAVVAAGQTSVVSADVHPDELAAAVRRAVPDGTVTSWGTQLAVLKGVGAPADLAASFSLPEATGWQAVAHTRMATESAVTSSHSHPFSVGPDLCLVHNGSFSNHATIRRELVAEGAVFDSDNDSEVAARFVASRLAEGADLEKALRLVCERFDGFYTLLVTTGDSFAVVRDAIACKPAVIAQTPSWVAMASEFRALAELPGIEAARIDEPEPEQVYVWQR